MIDSSLDTYVLFITSANCDTCKNFEPHVARASEKLDVDFEIIDNEDSQFDEFVEALEIEIIPTVVYCDGEGIETYEGEKQINDWLETIW
jgi:thioredoxin-like negative regulator of GroEL